MQDLKQQGYRIVATGEMGIGNTTTSSAVASVLLGLPPEEVTGRGAGLSSEGLARKRLAVRRAIACNAPDPSDAFDVLQKVGGLDLAGMAGAFLGGAAMQMPVVIDGFISSAAALLAVLMCRDVKDFLLASHVSSEPGGRLVMDQLGLKAPLDCGMHLGEGSGAVALLPLLKMGAMVYENMSTFSEIHVESYVDYGAKKGGRP